VDENVSVQEPLSRTHHPLLAVIPSEAEGSAVSLSSTAEAEEGNCRSLGFARDDSKERVVVKSGPLPKDRAVVGARKRLLSTTSPIHRQQRFSAK
jgi:hypothetical protein